MLEKVLISNDIIETERNILSRFGDDSIKLDSSSEIYDATIGINLSEYIPIICLKKVKSLEEDEVKKYLKIYWNQNSIPLSIFIFPNEVRIYNNFQNDDKKALLFLSKAVTKQKLTLEEICSPDIFSNEFWDKKKEIFLNETRVDRRLLSNIMQTITILLDKFNIDTKNACNFMAKCIFIQYMEDREMLTPAAYVAFGVQSFIELLQSKNLLNITTFFEFLKNRFSGDIFSVDCDILKDIDCLDVITDFFNGMDMKTSQLAFLGYDFSYIPIELISSIYEKLFEIEVNQTDNVNERKKSGVYYTPYHLADFSIYKSFEYIKQGTIDRDFKGLDPACGSGVFLVGLFKKIVEEYKKNGESIDSNLLNQIITNQLYGIDKSPEALNISAFSLYIALMDYLNPKDINENSFAFPLLLGNSLICSDSFNSVIDEKFKNIKFDIIVGNPPCVSVEGEHVLYCRKSNIPISDKQIAQSYIIRARDFVKPDGITAFIVTNSIFNSTNARHFRKYILDAFDIKEIVDLSDLKNDLFSSASYPCSIILYGLKENSQQPASIKYYRVQKSLYTNILKQLVVESSGYKQIDSEEFQNDIIWRLLKYGTPIDYRLIQSLQTNPTLRDLKGYGIGLSEGAVIGNSKRQKHIAGYKNLPLLSTKSAPISNYAINTELINTHECEYFERPRDATVFTSRYKVLTKRSPKINGKNPIKASFYEGDLLFFNTYIAFYSNYNKDLLFFIEALLNSKFYAYYQFYMSDWFKIYPPEIRKDRLERFVIPNIEKNSELYERVIGCVKEIHEYIDTHIHNTLHSEIERNVYDKQIICDTIIFSMYGLSEEEIQSVNYTCDYIIPSTKEQSNIAATQDDLTLYVNEFKRELSKYIGDNNLNIYIKQVNCSYCLIIDKVNDNLALANLALNDLVATFIENLSNRVSIARKVKYFSKDIFVLAKTKSIYNWTLVNARLDVNEFISDAFNTEDE